MEPTTATALRGQLEDRRRRLRAALADDQSDAEMVRLLRQVDSALARLDGGDFGRCLVCREGVYERDLRLNPLMEYCLCGLTPEQQSALQNDLELARRIQAALLPDPHLAAAGWEASYRYEPAGVVGGDYCDLWVPPDAPDEVYFAVGDVSGKGVAASLLMAHIHAAFRALLGAGVPLADLVGRANRQLLDAAIPTHYATLACGRARRDGVVEIVNAGHCPPLVVRGGSVERIGPTGYPLGLVSREPYDVARFELGAGDALLLYTDGVSEARRGDGEEYGAERVESLLAQRAADGTPRQIVRALREDVAGFLSGAARGDDLTLLALGRARAA